MDATAEDIQSQKANIEAETAELEQEVAEKEQEVAKMEELSGSLDNVDTKIDDLTTETSTTSAVGKLEKFSLLTLTTFNSQAGRPAMLRPHAMRLLIWSLNLQKPTAPRRNLISLPEF